MASLQNNTIHRSYLQAQFGPDGNPKRGGQSVWLKLRVGGWFTFFFLGADAGVKGGLNSGAERQ